MQKQSTYLIFLISAACCSGRIVEWPVTLQFDIKSSADDEVTRRRSLPPVDPPFHSAGLLELNNTVDARLFFFYAQVGVSAKCTVPGGLYTLLNCFVQIIRVLNQRASFDLMDLWYKMVSVDKAK